MTVTLVLDDHVASDIEAAARNPLETAGVLLATLVAAPNGDTRLLGRVVFWVPDDGYLARTDDSLSIASHGYIKALAHAERLGAVPIWFHTHPGEEGIPLPSEHDLEVDRKLGDVFRIRSGSPLYGTLIVSPRGKGGIAFSGTLQAEDAAPLLIDRFWRVGDRWRLVRAFNSDTPDVSAMFDRHIRAFGSAIQDSLGDLKVAVVGCGGTGSAIAEQLVRLGVRQLLLVDSDTLSASNVTRVYGSTLADVGRPKAEVLRDHLEGIALGVHCAAIKSMVTLESTARSLIGCDLLFGCTDDNAGRLVISRLSTYLLIPVIDVGVLLSSGDDGVLTGIDGRVTVLEPGAACLVCRNRVDLARAAAELRTPEERVRLEHEGYAPALGRTEPAVVAYTTAVAAAAINEFLERLIGFGPEPRPSEVLLRLHERELSTNRVLPRRGHYCDREANKLGAGVTAPFLDQLWPTE